MLVSLLVMIGVSFPGSGRATSSAQFFQDFAPAIQLLHDMGLAEATGAEWGKLENPNDYSGGRPLFYDLEIAGGQWRLPGDRLMSIDGTVKNLPTGPGVTWKKADLDADLEALLKYLKTGEDNGYSQIGHQDPALSNLVVLAAHLSDLGKKKQANQIIAHALAASRNPREPIRLVLQGLANRAYADLLDEHVVSGDWLELADQLQGLRKRFASAWDNGSGADLLIEKLRAQEELQRELPEGLELSAADQEFVEALVAASESGLVKLSKQEDSGQGEGDDGEAAEQQQMMAEAGISKNPALMVQAIQGLFLAEPWWSKAEPEADADAEGEDESDDAIAGDPDAEMLAERMSVIDVATEDLAEMDKWRELVERRFDALPILLALAADERFLPALNSSLQPMDYYGGYGGYNDAMLNRVYSGNVASTPEANYQQMARPMAMSDLAALVLGQLLPGKKVDPYSDAAEPSTAALIAKGTDFYLRLKDRTEVEITREMFRVGGGSQALELLCRQGDEEDFKVIEKRLLSGLAGGSDEYGRVGGDLPMIYRYLKIRGEGGNGFYQKVAAEGKKLLAGMAGDQWQSQNLKTSLQRLDALYSTETAADVLARVLAEGSEETLEDVSGLLQETLSRETRDGALTLVLEAMLAHDDEAVRNDLLQVVGSLSGIDYGKSGGELSEPKTFGKQWLPLLEDERSAAASMGQDSTIGEAAGWMFLNLHEPDQVVNAHRVWEQLGSQSLKYFQQRAMALSAGNKAPDFPDPSSVDKKRVADLEAELLAASGAAVQKVWEKMSFSETLALRARLADEVSPPQALIDHLGGLTWQVAEVELPEKVTAAISGTGDVPAAHSEVVAAWKKLAELKGQTLDHAKLSGLFTELLPIASHREGNESWRIDMSGGSSSGGIAIVVAEIGVEKLAEFAANDPMLGFLMNRGLENPAAMLTVAGDELGGGIWLATLADKDSGELPDTPETELGGALLPASYMERNRPQWVEQLEAVFDPEASGDPSFTFSLSIHLTTSEATQAAAEVDGDSELE